MKTRSPSVVLTGLALAVLLTGCVQSYHPFCTPDALVPVPELVGQWDVVKPVGDDTLAASTNRPWVCTELETGLYAVVTYGTNEIPATILVATFKVDDQLYCDTTAGDVDDQPRNPYWDTSITRVHNLWKLGRSNEVVSLWPLNRDWLRRAGQSNVVALAYVSAEDGDGRLYTAQPKDWVQFLTKFGGQPGVFADDPAFVLRKRAPAANDTRSAP